MKCQPLSHFNFHQNHFGAHVSKGDVRAIWFIEHQNYTTLALRILYLQVQTLLKVDSPSTSFGKVYKAPNVSYKGRHVAVHRVYRMPLASS